MYQGSEVVAQRPQVKQSPEPLKAPSVEIQAPNTNNFFDGGRRIFPNSIQQPPAQADRASLDLNSQAPDNYPVGPGDQFLLNFWGRVEDNILVSINSEGKLFIPRIGVVETEGLTYAELSEDVRAAIDKAMKNVQFTMSLHKARQFQVYVLGSVANPGPVRASANMRASEIIASAGGVRAIGSVQFIELRRSGETARIDLLRYASFADFSLNPYVTDEDIIFVPNLSDFVTISGAVVRPGPFEIRETRELSEVIDRLGGLSVYADRSAAFRLSRLQSDGTRRQLRVIQKEEHREQASDLLMSGLVLQNGDEIFVPSAQLLIPSKSEAVFVTGSVRTPGPKPYQISTSIEEYIGFAGGLTERANFSAAVVYKSDGSTERLSPRMSIEPGDTIYIPERTFKFWQDHLSIVTTFITLATSIIVLSGR